jgi:predicted RNase H-like nuclease (RuvC/YqgF family)
MLSYEGVAAGIIGTLITGFITWFSFLRKTKTDEATIALEAWKELVHPMKIQMDEMRAEIDALKHELKSTEEKLSTVLVQHEKERQALLKRIRELEKA